MADIWADVRRYYLDAARLVFCRVGASWRRPGTASLRRVRVLGEQLLGRECPRDRRRPGIRRSPANQIVGALAGCHTNGHRPGTAREHSPMGGSGFESSGGGDAVLVDAKQERPPNPSFATSSGATTDCRARPHRGVAGLLLLAHNR